MGVELVSGIQVLVLESQAMRDVLRGSHFNLKQSEGQAGRMRQELKTHESKIALFSQELERLNAVLEKKNSEIRALGGQVEEAQENLRLSAQQQNRLSGELNEFKSRLTVNNQ